MSQRQAVTKANATRYRRAGKADKGKILDELCPTADWHRNHARKALAAALKPKAAKPTRRVRLQPARLTHLLGNTVPATSDEAMFLGRCG